MINNELLTTFFNLINEREAVRIRKEAGEPKPWTDDPILQQYKFTNVHREDDTVSRWLLDNWYEPHSKHPNLWFACCLARMVNWPDTLADVGFPEKWDTLEFIRVLESRRVKKLKVYTGAYMLRSDLVPGESKAHYTAHRVLTPLFNTFSVASTAKETASNLAQQYGWGPFLADQAVWDMTWTPVLGHAPDANTWCFAGVGALRGLNRLHGRPIKAGLKQPRALEEMQELVALAPQYLTPHVGRFTVRDCENCLCEFDKYMRVKLGQGRPRSLYPGV